MVRTAAATFRASGGKSAKAGRSANTGGGGNPHSSNNSHEKGSGGGNSVCHRDTPNWQKPITNFFIKNPPNKTNDNGESSSKTPTTKEDVNLMSSTSNESNQTNGEIQPGSDKEKPTTKEDVNLMPSASDESNETNGEIQPGSYKENPTTKEDVNLMSATSNESNKTNGEIQPGNDKEEKLSKLDDGAESQGSSGSGLTKKSVLEESKGEKLEKNKTINTRTDDDCKEIIASAPAKKTKLDFYKHLEEIENMSP